MKKITILSLLTSITLHSQILNDDPENISKQFFWNNKEGVLIIGTAATLGAISGVGTIAALTYITKAALTTKTIGISAVAGGVAGGGYGGSKGLKKANKTNSLSKGVAEAAKSGVAAGCIAGITFGSISVLKEQETKIIHDTDKLNNHDFKQIPSVNQFISSSDTQTAPTA